MSSLCTLCPVRLLEQKTTTLQAAAQTQNMPWKEVDLILTTLMNLSHASDSQWLGLVMVVKQPAGDSICPLCPSCFPPHPPSTPQGLANLQQRSQIMLPLPLKQNLVWCAMKTLRSYVRGHGKLPVTTSIFTASELVSNAFTRSLPQKFNDQDYNHFRVNYFTLLRTG